MSMVADGLAEFRVYFLLLITVEDEQKIHLLLKLSVVLALIWGSNRLKSILMAIKGIYRPLMARKKSLQNYDVTSFDKFS